MQNKHRNKSLDSSRRGQAAPISGCAPRLAPSSALAAEVPGAHTAGPSSDPAQSRLCSGLAPEFPLEQAQTAAPGWLCSLLPSCMSCSGVCAPSQAQEQLMGHRATAEPSHLLLPWPGSTSELSALLLKLAEHQQSASFLLWQLQRHPERGGGGC